MQQLRALIAVVVLCVSLLSCATANEARFHQLQTLNTDLLASSSATATLERWCREHDMATPPTIVAQRVHAVQKPPTAQQLTRLKVQDASAVKYRRVQLRCGPHVLSEADNWYVPARLTTEMNQQLDTTDTPFGKVVRPLSPYRRTIESKLLWSPSTTRTIPKEVMVHTAILYTPDHQPFSEVVETYQAELFHFR
ncbi:MAG TPA: hypothetical protein VGF48_02195 [Thermoanaerobaculia bacterium]|jgi:chorismate-pyruvate lyase